jgi:hypothetical protein
MKRPTTMQRHLLYRAMVFGNVWKTGSQTMVENPHHMTRACVARLRIRGWLQGDVITKDGARAVHKLPTKDMPS